MQIYETIFVIQSLGFASIDRVNVKIIKKIL
uniref:Uncharacterized protein n=1 Tax=uncultured marine bacterium 582 TaxID=257402 RepID=Q6SEZ3_9BACT|nr:hypothetical protein MBMO_EBAC080-L028H02.94 [uncultured marine bacterium 582]